MKNIFKGIKFLKNKEYRIDVMISYGFSCLISDKTYIRHAYKSMTGRNLNLDNPQTFAEKIQWLKIYDRQKIYSILVDKYEVKNYLKQKDLNYYIPTLGIWNNYDEIDFDKLPNKFVLKCTHDSGGIVICKDKNTLDHKIVKMKIEDCLKRNYYWLGREWPYKKVIPRIIAEEYLEEEPEISLVDYKFFCFNGKPEYCQVITNRGENEKIDFFDMMWNVQPFTGLGLPHKEHNKRIEKPINFEKMKQICQVISEGLKFLRVDFYEVKGTLYIGELTLYPASGFGYFYPEEWNSILGEKIQI